jgi:hypothetical protein
MVVPKAYCPLVKVACLNPQIGFGADGVALFEVPLKMGLIGKTKVQGHF